MTAKDFTPGRVYRIAGSNDRWLCKRIEKIAGGVWFHRIDADGHRLKTYDPDAPGVVTAAGILRIQFFLRLVEEEKQTPI